MPSIEEQIAQLRSAISAQETLRPTLGDSVVEVTLQVLRTQIDSLLAEAAFGALRPSLNFLEIVPLPKHTDSR